MDEIMRMTFLLCGFVHVKFKNVGNLPGRVFIDTMYNFTIVYFSVGPWTQHNTF